MRSCDFGGCDRKREAKGLCKGHYQQARSGRPLTPIRRYVRGDVGDRLRELSTDSPSGCRVWTGSLDTHGYGQINVEGEIRRAHRAAWELANGRPSAGNVIDHKCGNRACLNLDHLREVTHAENIQYRTGLSRNNTSGYRGVTRAESGRWVAQVVQSGVRHYLGRFDTPEEAAEAVQMKRAELYRLGDFEGAA